MATKPAKKRSRKKKKSILTGKQTRTIILVSIGVIILLSGVQLFVTIFSGLPSLESLEQIEPSVASEIYSKDGKLIRQFFEEKRTLVSIDEIPMHLQQALIAIEDKRFYDHWGFSSSDFFRALIADIKTLSFSQGASTITQQLARTLFLHRRKSLIRKAKEAVTAVKIERTYSKSEILEMFLNIQEFGEGSYGIQSAARIYFDKDVQYLDLQESAVIVGQLQGPTRYNPRRNPENAIQRRNIVLKYMLRDGYIDQETYEKTIKMPLNHKIRRGSRTALGSYGNYYTEHVVLEIMKLQDDLGVNIKTDGLKIYTSMDSRLQKLAEKVVKERLEVLQKEVDKFYTNSIRVRTLLRQADRNKLNRLVDSTQKKAFIDSMKQKLLEIQSALVSIDVKTGNVVALVGGKDFLKSKWNRATQMTRQPGSAFKPFMYTAVIDNGYPVTTKLLNQDIVLYDEGGKRWAPRNFDGSRGGETTLREGIKRSLNLISGRILQELVPPKQVVSYAKKMGISTNIRPVSSLAMGTSEVYPVEITSAYSIFANHGIHAKPRFIERIEDRLGNVIYQNHIEKSEVLSEETAYVMVDLLKTVVKAGTGRFSHQIWGFNRPAGGKTGTTQDYTDTWFVGFTPQIATGVWVGFDDQRAKFGASRIGTGTTNALPIWSLYMKAAHDSLKLPEQDFDEPDGVIWLDICKDTKKLAGPYCEKEKEIFIKNKYVPEEVCTKHNIYRRNR